MSKGLMQFLAEQTEPAANPALPADAGTQPIAARQSQARDDQERARLVYRQYQENIRKGSQLETALLKDLQNGQNLADCLLQAVHIMSLYTGNTAIEPIVKRTIETVYRKGGSL
jgi:hypothetical protein